MTIVQIQTKILLPEWLLRLKHTLPDKDFTFEVLKYLVRYSNYQLQEVQGEFAICIREDEVTKTTKRRKKA